MRGAEPTHEASAEPNLFEFCLARRRKTIVKALWARPNVPEAVDLSESKKMVNLKSSITR